MASWALDIRDIGVLTIELRVLVARPSFAYCVAEREQPGGAGLRLVRGQLLLPGPRRPQEGRRRLGEHSCPTPRPHLLPGARSASRMHGGPSKRFALRYTKTKKSADGCD